jgi:hypothetical protein
VNEKKKMLQVSKRLLTSLRFSSVPVTINPNLAGSR